MKKFGTILLLLLVILYTFGLFTVYAWNSMVIKQSMQEAIATESFQHSQLVTFTISLQQLTPAEAANWQQDEITSNGKMYDVVSARQANGQLTIKCISDEDENLLLASYQQAVENGHAPSPAKNSITLKNVFSPFIIYDAAVWLLPTETASETSQLLYQPAFTKMHSRGVVTPPPRQV